MKRHSWAKNMLLLGAAIFGFGALTIFLMGSDRVAVPLTFQPESNRQRDIERVAKTVDLGFERDRGQSGLDLELANRADDLTIARRLALGLAGTLPSVQEIRKLESLKENERIHWWVSHLLEDRRTSNQLAERFARAFVGVDEGPFVAFRRRRFVKWLSDKIHRKESYDRVVHQVLTDDGLWTDSPAVNFYSKTLNDESGAPDPILLAGRTSRAMLGMRIDCLQCHDDFLGTVNLGSPDDPSGGMQTDFHSLAAFFANTNISLLGIKDNGNKNYMYQLLDDDEESEIPPAVPFNRELFVESEQKLTKQLADWVVHPENRPFARAAVNRIWAIMTGKPLVEPVDDIPLDGPFPSALESLVDDFVEHEFDLHRLIRVIAETNTFQRDSRASFEISSDHTDHWAVFPLVRLRPDQVAGAIIQSTSLKTIDSTAHIIEQLTKFGSQNEFVQRYGDAGEDEFLERGETVTQRLLMLNGSMVRERLNNGLNSPIHIRGLAPSDEKAIETVYLATLCREPSGEELEYFKGQMEGLSNNERTNKVVDLYWTLINSIEFVWSH